MDELRVPYMPCRSELARVEPDAVRPAMGLIENGRHVEIRRGQSGRARPLGEAGFAFGYPSHCKRPHLKERGKRPSSARQGAPLASVRGRPARDTGRVVRFFVKPAGPSKKGRWVGVVADRAWPTQLHMCDRHWRPTGTVETRMRQHRAVQTHTTWHKCMSRALLPVQVRKSC